MTTEVIERSAELETIAEAELALRDASSLPALDALISKAQVFEDYLRSIDAARSEQNRIGEVRLRACRKAGQMAEEQIASLPEQETIDDLFKGIGLTAVRSRVRNWRKIATIPDEQFESHLALLRDDGELTMGAMLEISPGLGPKRHPTLYRPEVKERARELFGEGYGYRAIAKALGIGSSATVEGWIDGGVARRKRRKDREVRAAEREKKRQRELQRKAAKLPKDGLGGAYSFMRKTAQCLQRALDSAEPEKRKRINAALVAFHAAEDDLKRAIADA